MLEAMNRELSSLIYLHSEDMQNNCLLAYSPAYSISVKQGGEYGLPCTSDLSALE